MVTAMRELQRLERNRSGNASGNRSGNGSGNGAGFRRNAAAWLTLAALVGLCLSQPFHNPAPIASAHASGHGPDSASLVVAAGGDLPAQRAAHDADLCSVCRATAQARLGLRVASTLGELATSGQCLPLHLPAPALASAAPALRNAQPRAPPTSLLVLSA